MRRHARLVTARGEIALAITTLPRMHVTLGPIPSPSVRAWVTDARSVLEKMAAEPAEPGQEGVWLPADVVETFLTYLAMWEKAASGDDFRWEGEIATEQAEYLMHAFFRLAHYLSETLEDRGYRYMSEAGDEFYRALVTSMVEALEHEGTSSSEFSQHLRSFWPGLFNEN